MAGQMELVQHMDHQAAEAAAEIDVLLRRDALVAKHQQVMVQVRLVHTGKIGSCQFTRQVQADDLRAQRTGQGAHVKRLRVRLGGGVRFAPQGIALGHRSLRFALSAWQERPIMKTPPSISNEVIGV